MRRLALVWLVCLGSVRAQAAPPSPPPPPPVSFSTLTWQGVELDVVAVNLSQARLRLLWQRAPGVPLGSLLAARDLLVQQGEAPLAITNAGIYGRDDRPLGLHVEEGRELHRIDLSRARGNFYLQPNGVFFVDGDDGGGDERRHDADAGGRARILESHEYAAARAHPRLATQSGPLLVRGGELHPRFTAGSPNTLLRSGVGVRSPTEIFLVVSRGAINFHDFATFFRDRLACPDALFLDGTISRLYAPTLGRTADGLFGDGHFVGLLAVLPGRAKRHRAPAQRR